MRIISKEDIKTPLHNPSGESVYELVGKAEDSGGTQGHSLAHIVIPPGNTSHTHYHQISEETYYILSGTGTMRIDEKGFTLQAGQACLIEPGEVHRIANEGSEDLVFLAVCSPPWTPDDSFSSEFRR